MSGLLASQLSPGCFVFWPMTFDTAFDPYFDESSLCEMGQGSSSTWWGGCRTEGRNQSKLTMNSRARLSP